MPPFLVNIGAALAANALKTGLAVFAAIAIFGAGYVMGDTRATKIALQEGSKAAQAQVAAAEKAYQATIGDYVAKVKEQKDRGDALADQLAQAKADLIAKAAQSKENISHAIPPNPACDVPLPAIDELRSQPARQ